MPGLQSGEGVPYTHTKYAQFAMTVVIWKGSSLGRGDFKNEGDCKGEWGRGVKMGELWKSVNMWKPLRKVL